MPVRAAAAQVARPHKARKRTPKRRPLVGGQNYCAGNQTAPAYGWAAHAAWAGQHAPLYVCELFAKGDFNAKRSAVYVVNFALKRYL